MQSRFLLEISVESVDAAMAAERGGAQRIELCSNAREGGTTPSGELMRAVRERVSLPIFSMVRSRAGNFVYTDKEFGAMRREIEAAKEFRMDGVVLGLLDADGEVDIARTKQLVELARPLPITFHRAFDECAELRASLEDVIETGASRLLTSGGKRTAPEALGVLAELVRIAGERLIVMPGSGLHAGNIREAVAKTAAREFHAGLSSVVANPGDKIGVFEEEVRRVVDVLRDCE
ncbi:MAG TPA: copper homeostasis protein CutC [Candidatus Acidoferrum sp.]|nr:copper homeostasis protein CutC [Candidatus Acidoferrum sp.]